LIIGTLDLMVPNLMPPPEFIGTAASRICHSAASRKSDSGTAEGSIPHC